MTIDPGAPAQVVLGATVTLSGSCCSAAAAAAVPASGTYRWLLAALLLALLWRLGPRSGWRAGVLGFLAWWSFGAGDRRAGASGTCALAWQAQSAFEAFTGTGAQFSFTPTVPGSFQITLSSGSAVATRTLTVVSPAWVWRSAAPAGYIQAIWASAPNDAWAVGLGGFVMHWDGLAWTQVASGTINNLSGIWGSSANDVWAVAGGVGGNGAYNLIHWNGSAWSPVSADTDVNLAAVWGSAPDDVWAVGGSGVQGVITHFNGFAWHMTFDPLVIYTNFKGVWGSGPTDVWAAGYPYGAISPDESHSLIHHALAGWDQVADNAPNAQAKVLTSVWVASTGEAWASGYGAILHWDGTAWAPSSTGYYQHVWGRAANDVWAVGTGVVHYNGSTWANQGLGGVHLYAVGGADSAAGGVEGVWAGTDHAVFEFVPGATLNCQTIGGTCGGCASLQGHLSDYSCDPGTFCCVSLSACGGPTEPVCCRNSDHSLIPGLRPSCNDGAYTCGPGASPFPSCGGI